MEVDQIRSKFSEIQNSVGHCAFRNVRVSIEEPEPEICVFIAKMIPVRISELNPIDAAHAIAQLAAQGLETENAQFDHEVFLALGRVFSGTITAHSNRPFYVLGYHHDPYALEPSTLSLTQANSESQTYRHVIDSSSLGTYMCLGPSIQSVESVPAGNIVAIYGLDQYVLKSGTLTSSLFCYPMTAITFQAKPMLQVAIEPTHHINLKQIEIGLQKLYQYDPVVEVGAVTMVLSTIVILLLGWC